MPAYVIADVTVTDPATMEEYRKQVPATIAKYGGRYLVRGGAHQTLEDVERCRIVEPTPGRDAACDRGARRW